jgi:hypothetical protein
MKTNTNQNRCASLDVEVPAGFCGKLVNSLSTLKEQLRGKFERVLPGRGEFVRELIADAEALAWETPFPHLFLPDFAELRLAEVLANQRPAFARAA